MIRCPLQYGDDQMTQTRLSVSLSQNVHYEFCLLCYVLPLYASLHSAPVWQDAQTAQASLACAKQDENFSKKKKKRL